MRSTYEPYVIIVPMPNESEKKACPRATSVASALSLEKSGRKKKDAPSPAPGRVNARIINTISKISMPGINILLNFSIPEDTPLIITAHVQTITTKVQTIDI
ncbi:hypothetical protein D3C78_1211280 [compost metagenome]